jgi:hypothetical protein
MSLNRITGFAMPGRQVMPAHAVGQRGTRVPGEHRQPFDLERYSRTAKAVLQENRRFITRNLFFQNDNHMHGRA